MEFDPVLLSRIQFAWVIAWHILMPAFTVGAASFIAVVEGLSLATGREVYARISTFWIKIFAIAFAMGVVTGLEQDRVIDIVKRAVARNLHE